MKRPSSEADGTSTTTCGLLALPPELRLQDFLDGGGVGGTQDLYNLSCAHRSLAHLAGLATRLDNVDGARLESLLGAFDRDRQHHQHQQQGPPPLTRAPTGLRHLAFGRVDWEANDQALCEALAEEIGRDDSGLAALERLDLSATSMHNYELRCILRALGKRGTQSRLEAFHPPRMVEEDAGGGGGNGNGNGNDDSGGDTESLPHELAQLPRLQEIHHAIDGRSSNMVKAVLKLAVSYPAASSRLTTLNLAGPYSEARRRGSWHQRTRVDGVADDALMRRYCPKLQPGCFTNLRVLRIQSPDLLTRNTLSNHGMAYLGDAWARGVFNRLEEFSMRGYARSAPWRLMETLVSQWRRAPPETFANLQVLRLHDFTWDFREAVALMEFLAEGAKAGDGRWDRLRVLDLTDSNVHDVGLSSLAAAIEAGFGNGLEELDFSTAWQPLSWNLSAHYDYIGPEGVRALCNALCANKHIHLRRLKLVNHSVCDEGIGEIVAAWRDGAFDALEELNVKNCSLTDESLVEMVEAGFLGHQPLADWESQGGEQAPAPTPHPPPPATLRRLVVADNQLCGQPPLPELLERCGGARPTTLTRLNLSVEWHAELKLEGLRTLLGLLGAGLRELKLRCPVAHQEAIARVLLEGLTPNLRRLDIRHVNVSLSLAEELAAGLEDGRFFPKLCQLELACWDVEGAGRAKAGAAARLRRRLIESRRPLIWDVLTLNRKGTL